MRFKVTLKNEDGEKCYIEVDDCNNKQEAGETAELERGAGWLAVDVKVIP